MRLPVAVTARSFHTVCLSFEPGKSAAEGEWTQIADGQGQVSAWRPLLPLTRVSRLLQKRTLHASTSLTAMCVTPTLIA